MVKLVTGIFFFSLVLPPLLFALDPPALVPRTGQTSSYVPGDDGDGQKGAAWPAPRFLDRGDGTVADNLTGLIWAQEASTPLFSSCSGGAKTWQEALDYVACLNSNAYLGQRDWLLPNIVELKSLADIQYHSPALPLAPPFAAIQEEAYWSSTTLAGWSANAWYVEMRSGSEYDTDKEVSSCRVWPLREERSAYPSISLPRSGQTISYASNDDGSRQRGVAWPEPRFSDPDDGTVTDNLTGLIWLKNADCLGPQFWEDALINVIAGLSSGSCDLSDTSLAGDWRMPNRAELGSLVDYGRFLPALPFAHPFALTATGPIIWSSSTDAEDHRGAWSLSLGNGSSDRIYPKSYTSENTVWPLRGVLPLTEDLAVTRSGSGSIGSDAGTLAWNDNLAVATYDRGRVVTLTATPALGHSFIGWSGVCSGTGPCRIIMNAAKNVVANFSLTVPASAAVLTPDLLSPQNFNTAITFSAAASGGDAGAYEYRFWWRSAVAGAKWVLGQAYSPIPTWRWDGAALGLAPGSYAIQVDTRHLRSPARYEAVKAMRYQLLPAFTPATDVTLTPGFTPPRLAGTTITFSSAAIGGDSGPYEYRFWWRSVLAGSTWSTGQAYATSPSWEWKTAELGLAPGNYSIQVDARHVGNPVRREAVRNVRYWFD